MSRNERTIKAIFALASKPADLLVRFFRFGKFSPWLVLLPAKLGSAGKLLSCAINCAALFQPFDVKRMSPLVVLGIKRMNTEKFLQASTNRQKS